MMMETITEAGRGMAWHLVPSTAATKQQQEAQQQLMHQGD
jgi:hypothetical protein